MSTSVLLSLNGLKPAQPAVGKDQIYYKVGRYNGVTWPKDVDWPSTYLKPGQYYYSNDQKMFEDVADKQGAYDDSSQTITRYPNEDHPKLKSEPGDPSTFDNGDKPVSTMIGEYQEQMNTVVLGPEDRYYLTDGHHANTRFTTMDRGHLDDFQMGFVVTDDFSDLEIDAFWVKMANTGNAWLKILNEDDHVYEYMPGVVGEEDKYFVSSVDLDVFEMPSELEIAKFSDDPYRAMVYFIRDIGWSKSSAEAMNFLEFYWAEEILSSINDGSAKTNGWDIDLNNYDLSDLNAYLNAIEDTANWMVSLNPDEQIGTSGYTAKEMGQITFDQANFDTLVDNSNEGVDKLKPKKSDYGDAQEIGKLPKLGKLAYSWAHKSDLALTKDPNIIKGTDARDNIVGSSSDDEIFGYGAADILKGLLGDDVIRGGNGRDRIKGGSGHDSVIGGGGSDNLSGGGGDDVLNGGKGKNKMSGGKGQDTFKIKFHKGKPDTVKDFTGGDDQIKFMGMTKSVSIQSSGDDAHIFNGSDLMAVVYGAAGQLQVSETGALIT